MDLITTVERVTVKTCYEDEKGIFLKKTDDSVMMYVGEYDLQYILTRVRSGMEVSVCTDPKAKYFALIEDVIRYSLR